MFKAQLQAKYSLTARLLLAYNLQNLQSTVLSAALVTLC